MKKRENLGAAKLPKEFKKYFWDVEFKKISLKSHLDLVLSRILSFGNMKAIHWLRHNISPEAVKEFVLNRGNRQLDKRSNNFWRVVLGLPAPARPCLAGRRRQSFERIKKLALLREFNAQNTF